MEFIDEVSPLFYFRDFNFRFKSSQQKLKPKAISISAYEQIKLPNIFFKHEVFKLCKFFRIYTRNYKGYLLETLQSLYQSPRNSFE